MGKLIGWESRLDEYIESRLLVPFKWGFNDCCLFAAGAAQSITGINYSSNFTHKNKKEALEYIKEYGGIDKIADSFLEEIPINKLMRGDVVLINAGRDVLGVFLGHVSAIADKDGVSFSDNMHIKKGWSVGRSSS